MLKDATGYNLTQLLVGSEGTLGIITEATLKLLPKPSEDATMLIPFADAEKACEAVSAIFRAGITPSAMEFMEREAVAKAQAYLDVNYLRFRRCRRSFNRRNRRQRPGGHHERMRTCG